MAEISGKGVPSSKTAGTVGDYYTDTDTNLRYKCTLAYMSKDDDGKDIVYYKWSKVNTGSSSGGTTNYSDLSNKPKVNGVDLVGNKSTADLKLVDEDSIKEVNDSLLSYIRSVIPPYDITWTDGGYISATDGNVNDEEGSSYSDFVEVTPGTKLIISNTMTSDTQWNVFYDKDQAFVSSFSTTDGAVIKVPENAKYFRLSKYTSATVVIMSEVIMPGVIESSSCFLIDSTSSDYSMTSASYGDKIKEALLSGCPVWYYGQETESGKTVSKYTQVTWFNIQQTDTEAKLIIGVGARSDGDVGGVAFTISIT